MNKFRKAGEFFDITIPGFDMLDNALPSLQEVEMWREIENRHILISEPICDDIVDYSRLIFQWNREDKGKKVEDRQPIKIFLNTPGGDMYAAESFYNIIGMSKTPIYIYNIGLCASAGFFIFLAGHKRYAFQGARFLIHEGEVGIGGQTTKVIENIEDLKKQEKKFEEYILSKTKIDKKLYTKNKKKEWWISSEAKDLGIVDEFITDLEEVF